MDQSRGDVLTWPMADTRPAIVQSERMMKTFIRVAEIWVPTKDRTQLQFLDGLYGPLGEFRAVSEQMTFGFDEGLPGKAWATRHPIILKKFENSYFKRTEAAKAAGLTCGVALPVFAGELLMAVRRALLRRRRRPYRRDRAVAQRSRYVLRDEARRRILRHGGHVRIQLATHHVPARLRASRPGLEDRTCR